MRVVWEWAREVARELAEASEHVEEAGEREGYGQRRMKRK